MARPFDVRELGHLALYVRDVDASVRFYRDLLGLRDTGRGKNGRIAFLSAGRQHHDLAIEAARAEAPPPPKGAPGLYHIAFQVGTSAEELQAARRWVEAHGLQPFGEVSGGQSPSFSIRDPDGHQIELYVNLRQGGQASQAPGAVRRT